MLNAKEFKLLICEIKKCKRHYKPFKTESDLKRHQFFSHKKFKCNYCPVICHNIYDLCKHKNINHQNSVNKEFPKVKDQQNLSQSSTDKEVLNCNNDHNLIDLNSNLRKRLKTNQKVLIEPINGNENNLINGWIKCLWNGCEQQLTEEEYEEHVNNHLLNPQCNYGQSFSEQNLLTQHKNSDDSKMSKSYLTNDSISVSVNKLASSNDNSLNIDINTNYKLSDVLIPDVGFKCHFFKCNEIFTDLKAFECHRIIHRNPNSVKFNEFFEQSFELNSYILKCKIKNCSVKSKNLNTVLYHMSSHFGDNPFKCDVKECFQRFLDRVRCREHEISHFYEEAILKNTFRCLWPQCNSQFDSKAELLYHIKIHLETQVNCNVCGKQFKRSSHLEAHKITHNLDKEVIIDLSYYMKQESNQTYICEWPNCNMKTMFDKELMVNHIKQHYGIGVQIKSTSSSSPIDSIHDMKDSFVSKSHSEYDKSREIVSKVDEKNLIEIFKLKKCEVRLVDIHSKKYKTSSSSGQTVVNPIDGNQNDVSTNFDLKTCEVRLYKKKKKKKHFDLDHNIYD